MPGRSRSTPRVLAAPDKFRGTASAKCVAEAFVDGARAVGWEAVTLPLADGGEGTLDALGGGNHVAHVSDPLGRPIEAEWRLVGNVALIEVARASGLLLVGGPLGNDPIGASTRGTGELINAAMAAGAHTIVVAVGGSATTDGGAGAMASLDRKRIRDVDLIVACDVRTPFLEAATTYARQKGANEQDVAILEERLRKLADRYRHELGIDVTAVPRSGAGGGLAGALLALGGRLVDGFSVVAEHAHFDDELQRSDLVLTGEGCVDRTSFAGKVVGNVLRMAREKHVPAAVIAGRIERELDVLSIDLIETFGETRALRETPALCRQAATTLTKSCQERSQLSRAQVWPPSLR